MILALGISQNDRVSERENNSSKIYTAKGWKNLSICSIT